MLLRRMAPGVRLLAVAGHVDAGWVHDVRPAAGALPEASILRYEASADVGTPHFSEALELLAGTSDPAKLDLIVLHARVLEADVQRELTEQVRASVSRQFEAALRSSGHHDNPAVLALREPFHQAVIDSNVIAELRQALSAHGLRIASVQVEKLTLETTSDPPRFRCFLWLDIQRP